MNNSKPIKNLLISIILIVFVFSMIGVSLEWWLGHTHFSEIIQRVTHKLKSSFLVSGFFCVFLVTIFITVYKYYKNNKFSFSAKKLNIFLIIVLRYWLAYENAIYGYAKIFKRFFAPVFYRNDIPVGSLTGFDLTWFYYGYSYEMACIIGFCQIIGAALLLFRRTTLIGVCMLLPIIVNIIFINIYYMVLPLAIINSLFITAGLLLLLLLRWEELKRIFLDIPRHMPTLNAPIFKWVLRIVMVVGPFLSVYFLMFENKMTVISGKWKVEKLIRNGSVVKENDWLTDPDAWKNIYLEGANRFVFSPNPYIFDNARSKFGTYNYDIQKNEIELIFAQKDLPADTVHANVKNFNNKKMVWDLVFKKDTLQLTLTKVEIKKTF